MIIIQFQVYTAVAQRPRRFHCSWRPIDDLSGLAFLETSVSPYLIRLGPAETAARRINFAAVFNPLGSIIGILGGRFIVLSGVECTECKCRDLLADPEGCGLLVTLPNETAKKHCSGDGVEYGCFVTPGIDGAPTTAFPACSAAAVESFRAAATSATKMPYLIIAIVLIVVAAAVIATPFPPYGGGVASANKTAATPNGPSSRRPTVLQQFKRWLFTALELLKVPRFRNGVIAQVRWLLIVCSLAARGPAV